MRKIKLIAIVIALGIIFAGCNMIEINEEKDRQTVVAKVGDEVILKGEVLDQVEYQLNMYIMYGLYPEDFATNSEYKEEYNDAVKGALDVLVDSELELLLAEEKGCFEFTEEERTELDDQIHEIMNSYINSYAQELVEQDEYAEMTEDELGTIAYDNLDTYFAENNYGITKQDIIDDYENSKAKDTLFNLTTSSVEVTEDEVKAEYDTKVEESKTEYEEGTASFEQDTSTEEQIYYIPENVRKAQHILIAIPEEYEEEIDALNDAGDTEGAEEKQKEALESIKDQADEAYQRAADGEDFVLLIEELGEDSGMESKEYYLVMNPTQSYAEEFAEALFSLENIGDISEPVASQFGYHIIKYYGDMESGPVAYDDVHDDIYDTLLSERKDTYYDEQFAIWKEEADIKVYYNRVLN